MRHNDAHYKLNRFTSWRKATLKSMARNILTHQSIRTTRTKARAARPIVEKLISLARENSLAARRRAFGLLNDHGLVKTLFADIGPRFAQRQSGFTRIINVGNRRGDDAAVVIFELTEIKKKEIKKPAGGKEKKVKDAAVKEETTATEEQQPRDKKTAAAVKERPQSDRKPSKKFLGNLRNIFKKERDSL